MPRPLAAGNIHNQVITMRHSIKYRIEYEFGTTYYLKPIFDVHMGSAACDVQKFKKDLAEADENTVFFFGGDLFDSLVVSDIRYRKSNDTSEGDAIIDWNIDRAEEILSKYKDRIIGIARGNHEDVITKKCGTDIIARLCKRLGVNDAGYSGLFRLIFSFNGGKGRTVIVRYHHGWGGGSRTQGADLTKFSKDIAYWDADVFLYGHVHRAQTDKIPRISLWGDKLISKPKVLCICGTYLKTYTTSIQPTYSEIKGYPPVEIGGVTISIKPQDQWVKIKASTD
jgi:UDP-2,3-diacylglucosamine pyrophosphatase LpxH